MKILQRVKQQAKLENRPLIIFLAQHGNLFLWILQIYSSEIQMRPNTKYTLKETTNFNFCYQG